jgi:hypothetical protein
MQVVAVMSVIIHARSVVASGAFITLSPVTAEEPLESDVRGLDARL